MRVVGAALKHWSRLDYAVENPGYRKNSRKSLSLGHNSPLTNRPDLFWAQSIEELEALVKELFSEPTKLHTRYVDAPPYWELKALLKQALAP